MTGTLIAAKGAAGQGGDIRGTIAATLPLKPQRGVIHQNTYSADKARNPPNRVHPPLHQAISELV